jgi:hypothetical protein
MNNTDSKYNGMNNVISRRRRHNPWIAFPSLSGQSSKPESAAELRGSGKDEEVDEDSAKHLPATETNAEPPQAKNSAIDVVSAEAYYILSKQKEDKIAANTLAAMGSKFEPDNTLLTAPKTTKELVKATPPKKAKGNFNPFLIAD